MKLLFLTISFMIRISRQVVRGTHGILRHNQLASIPFVLSNTNDIDFVSTTNISNVNGSLIVYPIFKVIFFLKYRECIFKNAYAILSLI